MTWNEKFLTLFRTCLKKYQGGNTDFNSYYSTDDLTFLKSIGYQPREFFDFIEDLADEKEPAESTALLIAAVRRDYFIVVQNSQFSDTKITRDDLPTFGDRLEGIDYLPRIIAKARAKLRGELDPDLMFGCGGDRSFLSKNGDIHPADFLRHVWAADGNDQQIADFIKKAKA